MRVTPSEATQQRAEKRGVYPLFSVASRTKIRQRPYQFPNPLRSLEDFRKFRNMDLRDMSEIELYKEEQNLTSALASLDSDKQLQIFVSPVECVNAQDWLVNRLVGISKERQRRQGV